LALCVIPVLGRAQSFKVAKVADGVYAGIGLNEKRIGVPDSRAARNPELQPD
jgi:hypothetical protein